MEHLSLSLDDLRHHVVTFGMDVHPPVDIPNEQTRLNMFFEYAKARHRGLFDQLVTSSTEFRISKRFRNAADSQGPFYPFDTFILTLRGPVFIFPLMLDEPVGETGLDRTHIDDFHMLCSSFFECLPNRSVMRLGLVRELLFWTGETPCAPFITDQASFAGANLVGGQLVFKYRDDKYNHNLLVEPVSRVKRTQLPVGTTVNEPAGYGVRVRLDVNNTDIRHPLEESDMKEVVERATSLWPSKLLDFIEEAFRRNGP